MKRRYCKLIWLLSIFVFATACSSSKEPFDDRNIHFKVSETVTSDYEITKTIEVTNQTGYDLVNTLMKISYPLKNDTTMNENSNSIQGISIESGKTVAFTISVPIDDKNNIDSDNPNLEFSGYYIEGTKEVPFGIVGSLNVIVD